MSHEDKCEQIEKEAMELRQNLWIWKAVSFVLAVLYAIEVSSHV